MPAVSQKQYKFMQGVATGKIKKKGLSRLKSLEFVKGVHYEGLPKRAVNRRRRQTVKVIE